MGSGFSRMNVLMSCGRPFQPLGRRMDVMRKMGSTGLDHGTPSTKMLLNNNNNDQELDISNVSIVDSGNGDAPRNGLLIVIIDSTKDKERGGSSTLEPEEEEEEKGTRDNIINNNEEEEEEEEEEEGGRSSDYEGLLWIRSPSFRDYCVDHSDDDDSLSLKNVNGGKSNGIKKEKQTQTTDDVDINEVCMMRQEGPKTKSSVTSMSKGRTGKRLRKVFSHRTGGMKNLFKVKNCYNPKVPHSGPGKPPSS